MRSAPEKKKNKTNTTLNSAKNKKIIYVCIQTKQVKEAQTLAGGALLDLEQLVEAQSVLVPSQALLVQLEFPQPFVLLVAS